MKPDRSYGNGDSQRRKLLEEELTREIIGAFYVRSPKYVALFL